jgi:hypothetical protein
VPKKPVYPDPDVRYGPFRVLPCTSGGFVVYDVREPPGTSARRFKTLKAATIAARTYCINDGRNASSR